MEQNSSEADDPSLNLYLDGTTQTRGGTLLMKGVGTLVEIFELNP